MSYRNATPVLRVSDYARAKTFYMDVLGFEVINEAGDPVIGFGIFRGGSAQIFLHSWEGPEAAWDGWRGYFYVDDLPALIARLRAHDQPFKGPTDTFYNMREVEVTDPDGNVLCFGTEHAAGRSYSLVSGKIIGIVLMLSALLAGAGLYYLQIYGFYRETPAPSGGVELVSVTSDQLEPITTENFQAIDADSSPIRYRACFETDARPTILSERFVLLEDMVPRNAPGWFDCFDAAAIGAALEAGTAQTFLGGKNVSYGVDRVVAITEDGRGFIWHELNDCGEKAYDGTIIGEECPPLAQQ